MITKFLKQFVFGVRREPQETFIDSFTTKLPTTLMDFNSWCIELKVSSRYQKKELFMRKLDYSNSHNKKLVQK